MKLTAHTIYAALLLSSLTAAACGGGGQNQTADGNQPAQVITIDGSSTVFPVTEAVAEEFQKANRDARHRRHLRHRRRIPEVLPRRDRHLPTRRARSRPARVRRARRPASSSSSSRRLRRPGHRREPEEHLGHVDDGGRAQEDLGAGRAGQDHRAGARFAPAGRTGKSTSSARASTRARSTTSPRRSTARQDASRGDYTSSEDDNVIVQGVSGDEDALGYFGFAYYDENKDKLKLVPVDDGDDSNGKGPILPSLETVKQRHLPAALAADLHLPEGKALERPEVKSFVDFYLNEGLAAGRGGRLHPADRPGIRARADAVHEPERPGRCTRAPTATAR